MDEKKLSDLEMDYAMICLLQAEMTKAFGRIAAFFESADAIAGVESEENIFADMAKTSEESRKVLTDQISGAFAYPDRVIEFMETHRLAIMWATEGEGE